MHLKGRLEEPEKKGRELRVGGGIIERGCVIFRWEREIRVSYPV